MITVHHLNFSRSSRVLWLMEELALKYDLVRYERDENFRAPASLRAVHPLGKAPVIQDGDLTIAESASILAYVNEHHGDGLLSPKHGSRAAAVHDEWLQYVESSAAFPIMMTVIGAMSGGLPEKLSNLAGQGVGRTLDYLSSALTPDQYIMGADLTLADIQMSYLLAIAEYAGLLIDRPVITTYLQLLRARRAFSKAIDIGGPMVPPRG